MNTFTNLKVILGVHSCTRVEWIRHTLWAGRINSVKQPNAILSNFNTVTTKPFSMKVLTSLLFGLFLLGCSNDGGINPSCYQGQNRKVVSMVKDATGILIAKGGKDVPIL